jgi:hypothetical protein
MGSVLAGSVGQTRFRDNIRRIWDGRLADGLRHLIVFGLLHELFDQIPFGISPGNQFGMPLHAHAPPRITKIRGGLNGLAFFPSESAESQNPPVCITGCGPVRDRRLVTGALLDTLRASCVFCVSGKLGLLIDFSLPPDDTTGYVAE